MRLRFWGLSDSDQSVSTKTRFSTALFQMPVTLSLLPSPLLFLRLPHIYIEALEPPLIDRVLILDLPIDRAELAKQSKITYRHVHAQKVHRHPFIKVFHLKIIAAIMAVTLEFKAKGTTFGVAP